MTIKVLLVVLILDVTLWIIGILHLWMSKRLHRFAMPIIKTGIAEKGSGFFGRPYEDTKVHRVLGYVFLYGVIYWYVIGWVFLLMIPIISVGLLYLDLFIYV